MSDKNVVSQIRINNIGHYIASSAYGICPTAASIATKEVTIQNDSNFILTTGITIHVKFNYHNAAQNAVLNVNNTGNKPILKYKNTPPGTSAETSWRDGSIISLTYDGTNWMMNDFSLLSSENLEEQGTEIEVPEPYNNIPNPVSAVSGSAGYDGNYARGDHTHRINVSLGSQNGYINIAGSNVKVHGIATAAYQNVASSIVENDTNINSLTTPKAVADFVQSYVEDQQSEQIITNSFSTISATGLPNIIAQSPTDTLKIGPGKYTSVDLDNTSKTVTINSTIDNLPQSENGLELSLVTTGEKWHWNHVEVEIEDIIIGEDESDFNEQYYKMLIAGTRELGQPIPDIIPPDFTLSAFYNTNNGDLLFFRQSLDEVDPDSGSSSNLTITYDADNYITDQAGKIDIKFMPGGN